MYACTDTVIDTEAVTDRDTTDTNTDTHRRAYVRQHTPAYVRGGLQRIQSRPVHRRFPVDDAQLVNFSGDLSRKQPVI